MNRHTAQAEAADPTHTDHGRWVTWTTPDHEMWSGAPTLIYHDNDRDPAAVPAELPTDADRRRAALDTRLIKVDGAWQRLNCYDCGMRQSRPIHGRCFE